MAADSEYDSEIAGVRDSVELTGYPCQIDHQMSLERTIRCPVSGHHMLKVSSASHVWQWWLERKEEIDEGILGGRPSRHDDPKMIEDPREPVVQWPGSRCVGVVVHQRGGLVNKLKRARDPENPVVRWRGCVLRKRVQQTSRSLLFYGGAGFPVFRFLEFLYLHKYTGRGTKPVSGSPQGQSRRVEELLRRMLLTKRKLWRTSGGCPAAEKMARSPWYKARRIGEARIPGPCEKERRRGTKPKFQDIVVSSALQEGLRVDQHCGAGHSGTPCRQGALQKPGTWSQEQSLAPARGTSTSTQQWHILSWSLRCRTQTHQPWSPPRMGP